MKKLFFAILSLVVLVIVGSACASYYFLMKLPILHRDIWVYVSPSTTTEDIYRQLADDGQISQKEIGYVQLAERFYHWKDGGALAENTGAYHLEAELPAARIVTRFLRHQQNPVRVTFNECRQVKDLAGKIADDMMCDSLSVLNAIFSPDFLEECATDSANVIGIFLPDTYETYWDISPDKFVRRMFSEYKKFWNEKRLQKAADLKLSPREVSIICSIAEEETQNRTERGVVARLYWNRLQIGMPLQADPTVKFAIGDFLLKRILNHHLEVDSPYNTYRVAGLPPGPIRMVEKQTIDALLDSKPHKYLYMCAKEDFSGTHNFAVSLAEHNHNAQKYHNALNKLK